MADSDNNLIRRISPQGQVVTLIGNGGTASDDGILDGAAIYSPFGVALDGHGGLYVSDSETHVIRRVQNLR